MIRVGITGSDGQLGRCLRDLENQNDELALSFFSRSDWDITNKERGEELLKKHSFDVLINTAAYTGVDQAESDPKSCIRINAQAPSILADECQKNGCHLIHISSDYVYHNKIRRPLKETDICRPKSVYGRSKLQGDQAIMASSASATIIRTSWVYSTYGHNFVRTMLRLAQTHQQLKVVQDQWGCPTSAHDLAQGILSMIGQDSLQKDEVEIIHFTNEGFTNWYEFAAEIFRITEANIRITPVTTESFGAAAPRPRWSILNCDRFDNMDIESRRHWKEALGDCLSLLQT